METIYYHLNARRVKVSGGPDLMTFSHAHSQPVPEGGCQLLNFELCKLRLERKAILRQALEAPTAPAPQEEAPTQESDTPQAASPRSAKLFLGLDVAASVAMLAVCATAVAAFVAIL